MRRYRNFFHIACVKSMKTIKKRGEPDNMKKRLAALTLAVLICIAFTACASSKDSSELFAVSEGATAQTNYATAKDADYGRSGGIATSDSKIEVPEDGSNFSPSDDRKLIKQASLEIQTKEFDQSLLNLDALISSTGSYIESRSISGYNPDNSYSQRSASIVTRVPADKLEDFLAAKDTLGSVLSSNVWQDDVTMSYVDTEARLASLKLQKERLLAILEKATVLTDIIQLETALSDTIYQIESYQSSLTRLDNQIAYSTVTISLREVSRETAVTEMPKTLGERISYQFDRTMEATRTFLEDLVVFLVGASPVLLFLAAVILALVFGMRASAKRRARRLEAERIARIEEEKRRLAGLAKQEENKQEPPKQ